MDPKKPSPNFCCGASAHYTPGRIIPGYIMA